jgi:hypothetical protein
MEQQSIQNNKTVSRSNATARASAAKVKTLIEEQQAVERRNEAFEQEADKMAERVMGMSSVVAGQEAASGTSLDNPGGPGQPLSSESRDFFEPRFGYDFSEVRIHSDTGAAQSAAALHANAYTLGNDIVFNEGRYAPHGSEGKRLLAHELTHVVQQSGGKDNTGTEGKQGGNALQSEGTAQNAAVSATSGPVIQKEGSDDEDKSWLGTIGDIASTIGDMTGGIVPELGMAGKALSGAGAVSDGVGSGETSGLISGALGFGGSVLDIAKTMGAKGLGTAGGILDVGESAVDAYSDFSKGKTGDGIFNTIKGVGSALGTGAEAGGFELSSALGTDVALGTLGSGAVGAGAEAAGIAGAVIGSGIAGWEAGKGLDKAANWVGQKVTGDDKGDYSISGGLASGMTAVDNALTPLWADPSKPAYTQTLGWKLGDWLGI